MKIVYLIPMTVLAACGMEMASVGAPTEGAPAAIVPNMAIYDMPGEGLDSFTLVLNGVRTDNSQATLVYNQKLSNAAELHAQDMVDNNYFSHTGQDGSDPGTRATAAGYDWNFVGENLAKGFTTDASVMNAWVQSESHFAVLVHPLAEDFGLGLVGTTWVLMVGQQQ